MRECYFGPLTGFLLLGAISESTFQRRHSTQLGPAVVLCVQPVLLVQLSAVCVCGGPRIACHGLECEATHTCTHILRREREEPAPLILHILSQIIPNTLSYLLPLSSLILLSLCEFMRVCTYGVFLLVIKHTHRGNF